MARYWYKYNGTGDAHSAVNYSRVESYESVGCTTGSQICLIYSPSGQDFPTPIINGGSLYNYITIALGITGGGLPQPTNGSKYYVYLCSGT